MSFATPLISTRQYTAPSGISLAADVGGDPAAPTVVLMHGGGQTRHSWGGAMRDLLSEGYQVINLDTRGHGDSDWAPDGDYGLESLAADLHAVIETLSSPPALVGASLGGATGLFAVGNTSEKIASALVLVDVVPHVDLAGADRIRTFMRSRPDGFATVEEAADAVAAYNSHRPRPTDTAGLMKNLRVRADGRLVWHWDPMIVQTSDHLEPPEFTSVLVDAATRVRIPTMLVRGLMSDVVTEAGVEEFRKILPELDVCDVVGAGHMVAGDKNDDFNRGVTGFLRLHLPLR